MPILVKNHNISTPKILQVEISSACNANCIYCPRTVLRDRWVSAFMDPGLFRKVIREALEIGSIEYVHLQGWGEPMLHPNLVDLMNEVSGRVNFGFTTNATLLDGNNAEKILSKGVNVIAITFAGTRAITHNSIRKGCDFDKVVRNVKDILNAKRRLGSDVRVIASYMMLSMNVHEIPEFIKLCSDLGIEEVVLDNLSYILNRSMVIWKAFSDPYKVRPRRVERIVRMAMDRARELGIKVFNYSLTCWELTECPEKPTESVFINVNGETSPCVFLNLPARDSGIPRCFMGSCFKVRRLSFGNVTNKQLLEIWLDKEYVDFRSRFIRRRALGDSVNITEHSVIEYLPPSPCISCYRLYGV